MHGQQDVSRSDVADQQLLKSKPAWEVNSHGILPPENALVNIPAAYPRTRIKRVGTQTSEDDRHRTDTNTKLKLPLLDIMDISPLWDRTPVQGENHWDQTPCCFRHLFRPGSVFWSENNPLLPLRKYLSSCAACRFLTLTVPFLPHLTPFCTSIFPVIFRLSSLFFYAALFLPPFFSSFSLKGSTHISVSGGGGWDFFQYLDLGISSASAH